MRKERMTVEELNSLKPSYENPVKLICDDGGFTAELSEVMVISPASYGSYVYVVDKKGYGAHIRSSELKHYPSLDPEKKRWFELWVDNGGVDIQKVQVVCDENFKNKVGRDLFKGYKKALGREVTEEIEKLEWEQ